MGKESLIEKLSKFGTKEEAEEFLDDLTETLFEKLIEKLLKREDDLWGDYLKPEEGE